MQGYDYLHLYDTFGVTLQLGGSDQWGNCLSGVDLIRRKRGVETNVVTLNLVIDKTTGRKFGKSEAGAVWLDETKTSPFKFYQLWINAGDDDAEDYLKFFTELTKDQIDEVMDEQRESPGQRMAQKTLAHEVTKLVHGAETTAAVERVTEALFGGLAYKELSAADFKALASELKVVEAAADAELVEVLVEAGLASSKTEARRFLADSAVYINGLQFSSEKTALEKDDVLHGYVVLRRGKNATALVKIV